MILEENFKWHLEAFASELFIYIHSSLCMLWIHLHCMSNGIYDFSPIASSTRKSN